MVRARILCATAALAACLAAAPFSVAAAEEAIVRAPGYEVVGNTLLPPEALQARLADFPRESAGTDPKLDQLKAAAAAVQELYRRAGWGGVVAFLPEQTLAADGIVRIRVVEGRIARIDLTGNQQFPQANILASLPGLKLGQTPRVRELDEQIQMANESPVKTVQVLLQPGDAPGAIEAKVNVSERPQRRFNLRVDNTGNASTGRWRTALGWMDGNLLGHDEVLGLELQLAPEHPSQLVVASSSLRVPLYEHSMAADAYFAWYDVSSGTTATAAGDLDFAGRGHVLGLRLSRYLPRVGNIDQRLVVGLEDRSYDNNCQIQGLPPDACGTAGASVRVQPLGIQLMGQTADRLTQSWSLGGFVNLGLIGPNADAASVAAVRPGGRQHYTVLRGSYAASLPLSDATGRESLGSLSLRAAAQISHDGLVPGEQFGLGGAQNVRGYSEREVAGDSGLQATFEYLSPALSQLYAQTPQWLQLRGLLFADAGWARNQLDTPCSGGRNLCRLASVGVGLRFARKDLQARLDAAHALRSGATTRRGDNRLHFSLSLAI